MRALLIAGALTAFLVLPWGAQAGMSAQASPFAHDRTRTLISFGLGPEADAARRSPIVTRAPLGMLTSWFNGHADLKWMRAWRKSIRQDYSDGYAMQLVVWAGDSEVPLDTPYGPACGRAYPLSRQFLDDVRALAHLFAGPRSSRFYVSLFAEFQTYPCRDNTWAADAQTTNYYRALKDQYRAATAIFHTFAPNSEVSLCWGGWQVEWDDATNGGGKALFAHFADVMRASDFESFQMVSTNSEMKDTLEMTRILGDFGPVMLAYYLPNGDDEATKVGALQRFFSAGNLQRLRRAHLFAIGLMNDSFLQPGSSAAAFMQRSIKRFGCRSCGPHR